MMNSIQDQIQQINLTINQSANNDDWEKVQELTENRHTLISNFINDNSPLDQTALSAILASIETADGLIKELIAKQKQTTIQSGLDLRHSLNAVNQYKITNNVIRNG